VSDDQERASGMVILGAVIIFLILRWVFGAADQTK
jgi:hypothetical protein